MGGYGLRKTGRFLRFDRDAQFSSSKSNGSCRGSRVGRERLGRSTAPQRGRAQQAVDQIIRDQVGKLLQQGCGAGRGKGTIHAVRACP